MTVARHYGISVLEMDDDGAIPRDVALAWDSISLNELVYLKARLRMRLLQIGAKRWRIRSSAQGADEELVQKML